MKLRACVWVTPALFITWRCLAVTALDSARVTQVVSDVNLLAADAKQRPAVVGDNIVQETALKTGIESRAELTFSDLTITRLGANTIFTLNKEARSIELGGGAMLLCVPKGSGGATIRTAAVTAAITGTTLLFEFHAHKHFRLVVLEGKCRCFHTGQEDTGVWVHAGELLQGDPDAPLTQPLAVDLTHLLRNSSFFTKFSPLSTEALIVEAAMLQANNPQLLKVDFGDFKTAPVPLAAKAAEVLTVQNPATPTPEPISPNH